MTSQTGNETVDLSNTNARAKRRWSRFTLRTLLVAVAIFCVWLGYYANWRRQRNAMIADASLIRSTTEYEDNVTSTAMPIGLRLLGAKPYFLVHTVEDCDEDKWARVQSLFPEAMVLTLDDFPEDVPIESMPDWDRLRRERASRD